ncbi:MAG: hypothetical protein QOE43_962 [Gaiellaceae bacterium]|nr:hypothetical protein [Gaiellaceae bacterium]
MAYGRFSRALAQKNAELLATARKFAEREFLRPAPGRFTMER